MSMHTDQDTKADTQPQRKHVKITPARFILAVFIIMLVGAGFVSLFSGGGSSSTSNSSSPSYTGALPSAPSVPTAPATADPVSRIAAADAVLKHFNYMPNGYPLKPFTSDADILGWYTDVWQYSCQNQAIAPALTPAAVAADVIANPVPGDPMYDIWVSCAKFGGTGSAALGGSASNSASANPSRTYQLALYRPHATDTNCTIHVVWDSRSTHWLIKDIVVN